MVCYFLTKKKKKVTLTGEVDNFILVERNTYLHRANISCVNGKTIKSWDWEYFTRRDNLQAIVKHERGTSTQPVLIVSDLSLIQ